MSWEVNNTEPQSQSLGNKWALMGTCKFVQPLEEDFELQEDKCQGPSCGVGYPDSFPIKLYSGPGGGQVRYVGGI